MKKNNATRKLNPILYILVRLFFLPYLVKKYRIVGVNSELFKTLPPPFLVVGNHVSMFDPPMVNVFIPHRIHFVMSDANLRTPIPQWAYGRLCNVIAKTKAVTDSGAVRKILQLIQKNRIICLFPEGRSSWDGVTHNIFPSTAKLIRKLQIPVVVPLIEGGYLSHPRWGVKVRPGKLVIRYKKIFDGDELQALTVAEIHQRLVQELDHDDYQFQRQSGQHYYSARGAEYLERLLFICPNCKGVTTLRSEGNRFFCTCCAFDAQYTSEGFLLSQLDCCRELKTLTEWVNWQQRECDLLIQKTSKTNQSHPFFRDQQVTLWMGYKTQPLTRVSSGTLSLFADRFVFTGEEKLPLEFPIHEIEGVQVLLANKFEFYYQGSLYKFDFFDPRTSGYKYMLFVQKIAPANAELD
ncbi:MAG: 1-acyl-sn-glycerol-3-phosphate acyltransferase [Calditrichaeota bacterium]|nr:MAG: 1-acyl-sn-glycerol-3-phosphate acyltransferase [Calditrichota bacterium]